MKDSEFDKLIEESMERQRQGKDFTYRNHGVYDDKTDSWFYYLDAGLYVIKEDVQNDALSFSMMSAEGDEYYGGWPELSCPA